MDRNEFSALRRDGMKKSNQVIAFLIGCYSPCSAASTVTEIVSVPPV